jgi:hypothetical protein
MPRFAILEHDHPHRHWDLLLESGDFLRSWRLDAEPQLGQTIRAEAIPDHRLLYLDYEGPVGGNRGRVKRWDNGLFTGSLEEEQRIALLLEGRRLQGAVTLEWRQGPEWRVTFQPRDARIGE